MISDRFGEDGLVSTLGNQYSQAWSWGDLLAAQKNEIRQAELSQYMQQNNISKDQLAAVSGFQIEREELNFDVSWAYGLTSKWMFGFQLPVSLVTTKVASQVNVEDQTAQGYQVFTQNERDVGGMVEELVRTELEDQGYRNIPTEREQWVWGDISLMNQYQAYSDEDVRWSLQQTLRMPTSRNPSLSDFALAQRDEGQIDVGVTQLLEKSFGPLTGIWTLGYINQLPGLVRVNGLENQREIERDLGDIFWTGVESRFSPTARTRFSGAYRYFYKEPDEFIFPESTSRTDVQQTHLARVQGSYIFTTVERKYEIEKKWLMSLQLQSAFAGVNIDRATSALLEVQTYF